MLLEVESIFLLIFQGIGVFGMVSSIVTLFKSVYVVSWPSTIGEIVNGGVEEEFDSDGDVLYQTKIEYRYSINGLTYKSSRVAYGLMAWNVFWLVSGVFSEATKNYPSTRVKYNPKNPGESTLISGVRRFHIANLIFFSVWNWLVFKGPSI